jgi:hypothetical protein
LQTSARWIAGCIRPGTRGEFYRFDNLVKLFTL